MAEVCRCFSLRVGFVMGKISVGPVSLFVVHRVGVRRSLERRRFLEISYFVRSREGVVYLSTPADFCLGRKSAGLIQ